MPSSLLGKYFLLLTSLLLAPSLVAQINYSEESALYLASLFASERDEQVEDCLKDGWDLAESLSYLSDEEQAYVFGMESTAQLDILPNGLQLTRPVRLVWGQKIGVDDLEEEGETIINRPAPTLVNYGASPAKPTTPADLLSVSGLDPSDTLLDSPPIALAAALPLLPPEVKVTFVTNTPPASILSAANPNDPAISQLEYSFDSGEWKHYLEPIIVATDLYPSGVDISTRVAPKSGFEASYLMSEAETKVVRSPSNLNAGLSLQPITFERASPDLTTEGLTEVKKVAAFLIKNPKVTITIEGHTDSDKSEEYNQKLSEARAMNVASALSTMGIDSRRMATIGYGELHPLVPNTTTENKTMNRRIEFLF